MIHKWLVAFFFLVVVLLVAVSIAGAIFEREATQTYDVGAPGAALTEIVTLSAEKVDQQVASVNAMIEASNSDLQQVSGLIVIWCDFIEASFGI